MYSKYVAVSDDQSISAAFLLCGSGPCKATNDAFVLVPWELKIILCKMIIYLKKYNMNIYGKKTRSFTNKQIPLPQKIRN